LSEIQINNFGPFKEFPQDIVGYTEVPICTPGCNHYKGEFLIVESAAFLRKSLCYKSGKKKKKDEMSVRKNILNQFCCPFVLHDNVNFFLV
jgi:hypothetical protein